MDKPFSYRPFLLFALFMLASWYFFFFRLGAFALTDPDEVFYAQTAKEMVEKNEWSTPYLYGKPQFEKPILFYWLVEASFKAFGISDFSARVPSAIMGLIGVIATYFLGAVLYGRRAGIISALIVATNVEYIMLARACVTDMALAVFILLGFLFFLYGYTSKRRAAYIVSSVSFALAVLTKGPIGIVLPAAIVFLFLGVKRDFGAVKEMPLAWMLFAFLVVALPWYILMGVLHGKDFVGTFIGFHNITRFLKPEHKTGAVFYYYVPVLFGGFFPWSIFLPVALWESFKRAWKDKGMHLFLAAWFSVFFIFFSVSSTRLPTYIFPAFMPLAVLMGSMWNELLEGRAPARTARGIGVSHHALFGVTVIASVVLYIFLKDEYPEVVGPAVFSSLVLIGGLAASSVFSSRKKFLHSFLAIVIAVLAVLYPLVCSILPAIERYETSALVAQKLKGFMKPQERLGCESDFLPGLAFYTGTFPVNVDKHHELVTFLGSEGERVWCVLKEKNHIQLYTLDTRPFYTKPSYVVWRLGKKCIFTNRIPEDGTYLQRRERIR